MDAKQLEKMIGFAPGELEKAAEAYEKDEWTKRRTIKNETFAKIAEKFDHLDLLGAKRCFIRTCG